MPYKVAIAGLYKSLHFRCLEPQHGKPVLLDDTCYQLSFAQAQDAKIVCTALNSAPLQALLRALSFADSKRPVTKEILMRLNLTAAAQHLSAAALNLTPAQHCRLQELTRRATDGA